MSIINQLAHTLRRTRNSKSLKVKDIAALTKLDASLISRFESGARKPSDLQLMILSEAYGIELWELKKASKVDAIMYILDDEPDLATMVVEEVRAVFLRGDEALNPPKINEALRSKLDRIDTLKSTWNANRPLNVTQLAKIREYFGIQYTYDSNRIEGNTLSLQETSLVVQEGITISGKSMREHLEAVNHAEAIIFIEDLVKKKEALSTRNLKSLHGLILRSIDREHAGQYRKVPVRITGSEHMPPEPYLVDKMMEDYFLFYIQEKKRLHPVILAADLHERLVSIHPFIDGNGRTARLVMNLILLQHGYTITNLKGDISSRHAYYNALEKVQMDNVPGVFYNLVADAVEASLKSHLAMV